MKAVLGGICIVAVAMGIGRFAYTPLLPSMQAQYGFTNSVAGVIAFSNYVGYFVGSLLCMLYDGKKQRSVFIWMIFIATLSLFTIGITESIEIIMFARFVSGVTSAVLFIFTTQLLLTYIHTIEKPHLAGYMYSGVGIGIVGSSVLIVLFSRYLHIQELWMLLALVSVVIGLFGFYCMRTVPSLHVQPNTTTERQPLLYWLYVAYFLEGLGYIITGTFIVHVAERLPTVDMHSAFIWLIVGTAAIPSCLLFVKLAERFQYAHVLVFALLLQAIGIVLPAMSATNWSFLASACLFGFTFMGITALTNAIVKQINGSAIGTLTAFYALGQIMGPVVAGFLFDHTHFSVAFVVASIAVFSASILVVIYSILDRRRSIYV